MWTVPLPRIAPFWRAAGASSGNPTGWLTEVKWDGWRAIVAVDETVRVRTRRGRDVTESVPELAPLAGVLTGRTAVLDGELVTCTDGAVDFYALPVAWLPPAAQPSEPRPPGR